MSKTYTSVGEVEIKQLNPFVVQFVCPNGHRRTTHFKKTKFTAKEVELRVALMQEDRINYTCIQCDSPMFDRLDEILASL